jgi:Domain of unknown function (DUF4124)
MANRLKQARISRVRAVSLFWIAAVLLTARVGRADIYFWQDTQGVIHFSNQAAPPEAGLYLHEPAQPQAADQLPQPARQETQAAPDQRAAGTEARLEQANRKLDEALQHVDQLTEEIRQNRAAAQAAAEAARQAAVEARIQADEAEQTANPDSAQVVVYAVPHFRYKNRHHGRHLKPDGFNYDTRRYPYYDFDPSHRLRPSSRRSMRPARQQNVADGERPRFNPQIYGSR